MFLSFEYSKKILKKYWKNKDYQIFCIISIDDFSSDSLNIQTNY
jgi:hypothetical protein